MATSPPLATYMARKGLTDGELATELGVSDELVRLWRNGHRRIPAERVLSIEKATGVSRHDLRPDIYPRDASPSSAKRPATEVAD